MEWYRSGHNEHDWKSCVRQKRTEGSNPSHSAKKQRIPKPLRLRDFFHFPLKIKGKLKQRLRWFLRGLRNCLREPLAFLWPILLTRMLTNYPFPSSLASRQIQRIAWALVQLAEGLNSPSLLLMISPF